MQVNDATSAGTRAGSGDIARAGGASDDDIRDAVMKELEAQPGWRPSWSVVYVTEGVVCLRGFVDSEAERAAARAAAARVPGVRAVQDRRSRRADWMPIV
jgi:osmotically-inducible protein OsmY